MSTAITPTPTANQVNVRVELTETRLLTKYYDISELPDNWNSMIPDEQCAYIESRGTLRKTNVDEIQERTDGVYLSWEAGHPEWTVTFTYTNTEIVHAHSRLAAIEKARKAIAGTLSPEMREGAEQLLGDADVDVVTGRWGL
jgi:hypothetical protein